MVDQLRRNNEILQKFRVRMVAVIRGRKERKLYKKLKSSVVKIQKYFRDFMRKKIIKNQKNDPERAKKLQQQLFIQKQREMANLRKKKRQAVRVIEKFLHKKLVRQKYRALRKKLAKIPPEMRIVYFKYMALRSDTNVLVNQYNDIMPEGILSPTTLLIE